MSSKIPAMKVGWCVGLKCCWKSHSKWTGSAHVGRKALLRWQCMGEHEWYESSLRVLTHNISSTLRKQKESWTNQENFFLGPLFRQVNRNTSRAVRVYRRDLMIQDRRTFSRVLQVCIRFKVTLALDRKSPCPHNCSYFCRFSCLSC